MIVCNVTSLRAERSVSSQSSDHSSLTETLLGLIPGQNQHRPAPGPDQRPGPGPAQRLGPGPGQRPGQRPEPEPEPGADQR